MDIVTKWCIFRAYRQEGATINLDERIGRQRPVGRGIGYVDVHLLAATLLTADASIWTFDARLAAIASALAVGYSPGHG